jgi:DNA-binding IclR family transcriptional regulator
MSKIVERTLDFFELFATEKRPLSLTELTRLLDIPASSCHDVLRALESRGYLYETAPRSGYYPTRRLYDLATVIIANDTIVERTRPVMERMSGQLKETVTLSKATGEQVVYLLVVEPEDPVRFSVAAGTVIASLHATSAGKAFLSTLAPEAVAAALFREQTLKRFTRRTIVSKAKLIADIEKARERGWFLNDEESRDGVVTISASFARSNANYFLTVAGPANRMGPKLKRAVAQVMAAARELGESAATTGPR